MCMPQEITKHDMIHHKFLAKLSLKLKVNNYPIFSDFKQFYSALKPMMEVTLNFIFIAGCL